METALNTIRWTAIGALAVFWIACAIGNAVCGIRSLMPHLKRFISPLPLAGMICGLLICALLPEPMISSYRTSLWLILLPDFLWLWPIPIVLSIPTLRRKSG